MKTITEHLMWGKSKLEGHIEDPTLSTKILLSFVTGFSKVDLILRADDLVSSTASARFQELIQKRKTDFPIAYLVGEKEFYSLSFFVNEQVLIPRPETEILIELFGEKIGDQEVSVCDVGTGSGAISVTLKKTFPIIKMAAVDVSSSALEVAKKNANRHEVKIEFIQSDLLEKTSSRFDVIVANLPYIPTSDILNLSKAVRCEPLLALDSGAEGLDHYQRLIPQASQSLNPNGMIFLEFGIGQKEKLFSLLQENNFSNIEVRKDLAGIDRIIFAQRSLGGTR